MKKALFTLALALVTLTACAAGSPVKKNVADEQVPDSVLLHQWTDRIQNVFSSVTQESTPQQQEEAIRQVGALMVKCCRENMDRVFPGELLKSCIYYVDKAELVQIAEQNPRFLEEGPMARAKQSILAWKHQLVGEEVTDLVMNDTLGVERHMRDMIVPGHYTLIDFWASWCGPCRQEMPAVKALYEKYHERGFDIIGVSFDQKREAWTNAIRTVAGGLPWQHISDLKGWGSQGHEVYGVNSIPCTLLVGPNGRIVANSLRAEQLAIHLQEVYGE